MPRWTSHELAQFLERGKCTQRVLDSFNHSPECPEASLHHFILEESGRRGFLAFHGSMAHRTRRMVGEPDFEILIPGGRVLLIEVKSRRGKLRPEQLALAAHARKLGHTVHVIRSQKEFLQLANAHENQSPERLRTMS